MLSRKKNPHASEPDRQRSQAAISLTTHLRGIDMLIAIISVAIGILSGFVMGAKATRTRYENAIEDAVRRNRLVR